MWGGWGGGLSGPGDRPPPRPPPQKSLRSLPKKKKIMTDQKKPPQSQVSFPDLRNAGAHAASKTG